MLLRLAAVVALVTVLAGGTWYFFRDTPTKRVNRWRDLVQEYLESGDLEEAERWQNEILKYSGANYDRMMRAIIGVRKGTVDGYEEAIEMYDLVLESGDPNALIAGLHKAKVLGLLGRYAEASNLCLSVMDKHPVDASKLLGETALASLDPDAALTHFERALAFVDTDEPVAQARIRARLADTHLLLVGASSSPSDVAKDGPKENQVPANEGAARSRERARVEIETAIELIDSSDPAISSDPAADATLLAGLHLKLGRIGTNSEGPEPFSKGTLSLEKYYRAAKGQIGIESIELSVRLGSLYLHARRAYDGNDKDRPRQLQALERARFLEALSGLSVEESAKLLESPRARSDDREAFAAGREEDAARRYVRGLAAVATAHLEAGLGDAIFADEHSSVELASRIARARESDDRSVRQLFAMLAGFAALSTEKPEEAREIFDNYLRELPEDRRAATLLSIITRSQDLAPGSDLSLDLYAKLEQLDSSPFLRLGDRLTFLLRALSQPGLEERAEKLLKRTIEQLREEANTLEEYKVVGYVVQLVEGTSATIEWLETATAKVSDDADLRRELVRKRGQHATKLAADGHRKEASTLFQRTFEEILDFYVSAPAGDDEMQSALLGTIRALDVLEVEGIRASILQRAFPSTDASTRRRIAEATISLFRKDGSAILRDLEGANVTPETSPYVAFLRGKAHILSSSSATLTTAIAKAEAEHRKHPEYSGNTVELLGLGIGKTAKDEDVPEDLIRQIEEYEKSDPTGFVGNWLLVEALRRRIPAQYRNPDIKNSEVARHVAKLRTVLRKVIRTKPLFTPAHVLLAETFTYGDLDRLVEKKRELFDNDYARAVAILKSTPRPTSASLLALADGLQRWADDDRFEPETKVRETRLREARDNLEFLTLIEPSMRNYQILVGSYLQTSRVEAALRVLGEASAEDTKLTEAGEEFAKEIEQELSNPALVSRHRVRRYRDILERTRSGESAQEKYNALLAVLDRRLDSLPNSKGLRHLLLATVFDALREDPNPRKAKKFHEGMILHYEKSVQAFDEARTTPPLAVLNNLAWHLVESKETTARKRGLELARRATTLVPNHAEAPDVHDTLAWALYRNEQLTEAERRLRMILDDIDSPTYRFHLATVLHAQQRHDEALEAVRAALDSPRKFAEEREARRLETEIQRDSRGAAAPQAVGAGRR